VPEKGPTRSSIAPLVALTLLFLTATQSAFAETFTGRVVKVFDGDSFVARDYLDRNENVRIGAIDAPERFQAFADRSRANLSRLIYNEIVVVEWTKRDKYGRIVGKVLRDGRDAGLEQVRAGLAWHFKEYEGEQSSTDRALYAAADSAARAAHAGLWVEGKPIPPWDFRHHRAGASPAATSAAAPQPNGAVRGNSKSHIYHWPGCPNYDDVSAHNRVELPSPAAAEAAGFRPARNCN
jgi:endonuclease YncB( thermonuclease family)